MMIKGDEIPMKKKNVFCGFAILMIIPFLFSGCAGSSKSKFIHDGDFQYYYVKEDDCYAIVGTTVQGFEKDILYIPPYFKDKPVMHMGYIFTEGYLGVENLYWISNNTDTPNSKDWDKIYFPYMIKEGYPAMWLMEKSGGGELFFPNCNNEYNESLVWLAVKHQVNYYVSPPAYDYIVENVKDYGMIHKANTLYMLNYEDAPNEGYFFVNNYTEGSLIQSAPYEPRREGHMFGGWYKEPECINAWDFETDVLIGETKLYAAWIKK